MKLVDEKTGKKLEVGQKVTCFRGEEYTLTDAREPHKPSSTGRVYVRKEGAKYGREFFPSVIGAKWVSDDD